MPNRRTAHLIFSFWQAKFADVNVIVNVLDDFVKNVGGFERFDFGHREFTAAVELRVIFAVDEPLRFWVDNVSLKELFRVVIEFAGQRVAQVSRGNKFVKSVG
jgi:hypothetical protein